MLSRKGFIIELIAFVVIGIIAVVFFALFIYGFDLVNTNLKNPAMNIGTEGSVGYVNLTEATESTFSHVNSGMSGPGGLELIAAIMLIGYALATLIFAYFSSKHQLWLFVYILIVIIIVIFSIYISNSYQDLMNNSVIGQTITNFGIASFIVKNLPAVTSVIGLIGIVLCIIGAYVRRSLE